MIVHELGRQRAAAEQLVTALLFHSQLVLYVDRSGMFPQSAAKVEMLEIEGNTSGASEARVAISEFRETQELIAQINRSIDEEQERELEALDDAIAGTDRHELRMLRSQLRRGDT